MLRNPCPSTLISGQIPPTYLPLDVSVQNMQQLGVTLSGLPPPHARDAKESFYIYPLKKKIK
eukprot:Pgem_evm1s9026